MTVERNHSTAIATPSDWLKNLALVFQPIRSKPPKTNRTLYARLFSRALSKLQAITSDWFIVLFVPVAIGRSYYYGIVFFLLSFENRSKNAFHLLLFRLNTVSTVNLLKKDIRQTLGIMLVN